MCASSGSILSTVRVGSSCTGPVASSSRSAEKPPRSSDSPTAGTPTDGATEKVADGRGKDDATGRAGAGAGEGEGIRGGVEVKLSERSIEAGGALVPPKAP